MLLVSVLVSGCAMTPNIGTDVATTGMPNAEAALRDSIHLVDAEMTKLGTMSLAATPRFADPVVPSELQKTVTFAYSGPLDNGVRRLAETIGYRVTISPPPALASGQAALPLNVSLTTGFVSALDAFSAIGNAAGTRALVRVDPLHHLVEVIHYA